MERPAQRLRNGASPPTTSEAPQGAEHQAIEAPQGAEHQAIEAPQGAERQAIAAPQGAERQAIDAFARLFEPGCRPIRTLFSPDLLILTEATSNFGPDGGAVCGCAPSGGLGQPVAIGTASTAAPAASRNPSHDVSVLLESRFIRTSMCSAERETGHNDYRLQLLRAGCPQVDRPWMPRESSSFQSSAPAVAL